VNLLEEAIRKVERIDPVRRYGKVQEIVGLVVEVSGLPAPVGAVCTVHTRRRGTIPVEVVGFREDRVLAMALDSLDGIERGDPVGMADREPVLRVGEGLLGRVIDPMGRPLDGHPVPFPEERISVHGRAPSPLERRRIREPLHTGIRAMDALFTCGQGQRMGIFAGSGVGKSVLLGMLARRNGADVTVVALVGERGREVREFIERDLGPEGLARSVVVVATSDDSAPLRVRAALAASSVAEYFRDRGKNVLLLMDSVTRIAYAQREIGLSAGEPPATKGYPPSVFALLARLLERAGQGRIGAITGMYTVLVEADELGEPIADAVRAILDGHLWLSRNLANRGHYPAIDPLQSVSRVMSDVVDPDHRRAAAAVQRWLADHREVEDMIRIGAYVKGNDAATDEAVSKIGAVRVFLQQGQEERVSYEESVRQLKTLAGVEGGASKV
jgi:FliI/YscN family ATPase